MSRKFKKKSIPGIDQYNNLKIYWLETKEKGQRKVVKKCKKIANENTVMEEWDRECIVSIL